LDVGSLHFSVTEGDSQNRKKRAEDGGRGCKFPALPWQLTADAVSWDNTHARSRSTGSWKSDMGLTRPRSRSWWGCLPFRRLLGSWEDPRGLREPEERAAWVRGICGPERSPDHFRLAREPLDWLLFRGRLVLGAERGIAS